MRFALLAFALLVACKPRGQSAEDAGYRGPRVDVEPSDAGPPPWPGWPLPRGEAPTAAMLCQAAFGSNADLHDPCMREYDPVASMRTYMQQALAECTVRLERSVLNGRAALDAAGAEQCISHWMEVRRSGRAEIATREHACDRALVGRQPAGALCREDWECVAGLGCAGLGASAPGKCTAPSEDGGTCAASNVRIDALNRSCGAGLWCGADRCQPTNKETDLCHPGSCGEGLFCSKGTNRCARALGAAEQPCKRSEDCDLGLYCHHSSKTVTVCKPQRRAGEKCLESIECAGDCRGGTCVSRCGSP